MGDLTHVRGRINTLYGDVEVSWKRDGNQFTIDVTLPANVTADVYMPSQDKPSAIGSGHSTLSTILY